MFNPSRKKFATCVCLLLLSACAEKTAIHGYLVESPIKIGERKEVVRVMSGDPTLIDGETWYYVRIATHSDTIGIRKSYSSNVMKVVFENDVVSDIQKINIPKEKALRMPGEKLIQEESDRSTKLEDVLTGTS
ncbi:lipoprotein [Neorickettsia sennetsu]|uniref:Lipoprotein n=1 Tax=Ehrlichia sennetsu (strain ATCC VR-367 / Miyayama) TaxID=222891 RepID=Q2GEK4_EHRS3|nr:lipoprotein [Neorickettsia sennetsu]ABD45693.1 putative lipoprotein [Neorickettsia sennetsu str. Miyayama]